MEVTEEKELTQGSIIDVEYILKQIIIWLLLLFYQTTLNEQLFMKYFNLYNGNVCDIFSRL